MNALTETEKAYLAGLIDGEGCIHISKQNRSDLTPTPAYSLRVVVAQSDRPYLEYWQKKTGIGFLAHRRRETANKGLPEKYRDNCLEIYSWNINSRDAASLIEVIKEYLVLKKEQADIALRFQDTMDRKKQGGSQKGKQGGNRVQESVIEFREKCRIAIMSRNQRDYQDLLQELEPEEGSSTLQPCLF